MSLQNTCPREPTASGSTVVAHLGWRGSAQGCLGAHNTMALHGSTFRHTPQVVDTVVDTVVEGGGGEVGE